MEQAFSCFEFLLVLVKFLNLLFYAVNFFCKSVELIVPAVEISVVIKNCQLKILLEELMMGALTVNVDQKLSKCFQLCKGGGGTVDV